MIHVQYYSVPVPFMLVVQNLDKTVTAPNTEPKQNFVIFDLLVLDVFELTVLIKDMELVIEIFKAQVDVFMINFLQ